GGAARPLLIGGGGAKGTGFRNWVIPEPHFEESTIGLSSNYTSPGEEAIEKTFPKFQLEIASLKITLRFQATTAANARLAMRIPLDFSIHTPNPAIPTTTNFETNSP